MTGQTRDVHPLRHTLVAAGVVSLVVALGGCYERVVSEKGPGARSDLHEPNRTTTNLERVIYGDDE